MTTTERPTLDEEHRNVTRGRVLEGARRALVAKGLKATTDDIAEAAGVGRRTVFRHFATLDELLTEAIGTMLDAYEPDVDVPPSADGDVQGWLEGFAVRLHRRSVEDYGQIFWDLNRPGTDLPPGVEALARSLPERRARMAAGVAAYVWAEVGGEGEPPALLPDALILLASGFAANSLAAGSERTHEETGRMAGRMMWAILDDARRRAQ